MPIFEAEQALDDTDYGRSLHGNASNLHQLAQKLLVIGPVAIFLFWFVTQLFLHEPRKSLRYHTIEAQAVNSSAD